MCIELFNFKKLEQLVDLHQSVPLDDKASNPPKWFYALSFRLTH